MKIRAAGLVVLAGATAGVAFAVSDPDAAAVTVSGSATATGPTELTVDGQKIQLDGVGSIDGADAAYLHRQLSTLIGAADVHCTVMAEDEGRCFVGGVDVGRWLVSSGAAPASNLASDYFESQIRAQIAGRGIWGAKG